MRFTEYQIHRDRKDNGGCQGLRGEEIGDYYIMGTEFQLWMMKKVLEMNSGDDCTTMYLMVQKHSFKMENLMLYFLTQ